MNNSSNTDMLHGPLAGKILKFALPFAFSSILQQLFNSVDLAVVGRFDSSTALASVGANTFLINLMINLFVGISVGANVVLANHIGQRDARGIRDAVSTTMVLSLIAGGVLLVFGLVFAQHLLVLMGTPAKVLGGASLYLRVIFLGTPFFMIFNFGAAVLRSRGDTKRPLYILMAAGVINTLLNLFTVIVLRLSVAGVAIATDVANLFSAFMVVWLLHREKGAFRLSLRHLYIRRRELSRILRIGLPAGVQTAVFSFSNVFVQSAINGYGPAAIAGASVAQMIGTYSYFLLASFCGAAVTFIGQNYGAGQMARCRRVFWLCLVFGFTVCLSANLLFWFGRGYLLSLFTTDASVVAYATVQMRYVVLFQSIAVSYEIPASAMRGFGHSLEPALMTIFGTCILRLSWIFLMCPRLPGFDVLMFCYPVSWVLTGLMVATAYAVTSRKAYGHSLFFF